jgi:hypothetical protein
MRTSAYVCATVCLATVYMIGVGLVEANSCVGLDKVKVSDTKSVFANIKAAIRRDAADRAACGSLASVLDKAIRRNKIGGRQLETDRPLDVKQAQANLEAAYRDPAISSRLEQVAQEVQDENVRLVYEAAILDEEGYYSARELKIEQLLQRAK